MIPVVVVDDQVRFRRGLRAVLSLHDDIEVVGEAANGLEALEVIVKARPRVVLMDLRMPGMDGVQATESLVRGDRRVKILVLTTFDDEALLTAALRAGASGYLLKGAPSEELVTAIRDCDAGRLVLHAGAIETVVREFVHAARRGLVGARMEHDLTGRELDVLRQLARGASNSEIARALFISEGTARNHLTSIFKKLGVSDRTQAALKALELGVG